MMDRDIEAAAAACCRICLESDTHHGDEFISPCRCKVSQQFVHRSCLDRWRAVKEGIAFSHCTTCKAKFHLLVDFLEHDDLFRRMKFWLFVAGDVFLIFLAIQIAIAAISGLVFLLDRGGTFRNSFTGGWGWMLPKHPVSFYYCVGVVVFLALVGLFGLLFHCFPSDYNSDPSCVPECSYERLDCEDCSSYRCLDREASGEDCIVVAIVVVFVFAVLGIVYGFIAATMAFQKIMQRHYHILTKKELTKVYVVADLKGNYSVPPKMVPEHEQRLKKLQLL